MSSDGSRRSGRRARIAQRAAKPEFDPCPPGQIGGAFSPLTEAEVSLIFETALKLLETLGMGNVPDRLRKDLLAAGAVEGEQDRVLFPKQMVMRAVNSAAKTFFFHGRDENRSIEVGGDRVSLAPVVQPFRRSIWTQAYTALQH